MIAVMHDGKYKLAQYGQWDGYPSGQGVGVLAYLATMNRQKLIAALDAAFEPDEAWLTQSYLEAGATLASLEAGFVSCEVSLKHKKNYPSLSRDTGSDVLALLQNSSEPVPLQIDISFAANSLYCEWAYVIDFDKGTFEVFVGFNHEPLADGERFKDLPLPDGVNTDYRPVRLLHAFPLDALPDAVAFLKICEPQEEDEEAAA